MQGVQRFGDYFLLKKIATGGMAELHKAKKSGEKGFEKLLAVKRILPHLSDNDDFITMFIDEAKVAALLNHQNIVQIYDLGRIEDSYCIVMEYVRGKDLRSVLHRGAKLGRPLPVEHACLIAAQALAGLSYAHRKKDKGKDLQIVHRDVSPQNILVSYEGEVKIVDFGIAKAATQSRDTKVGVLKGKLSYMSPEQARGKVLDARSDIFSAGVVFYEMLVGRKLFQGDTDLNTLERVREAKVEPLPTELNKDIPKELEEILLRSLAADPEKRFQSASAMEEALLSFMRGAGYSISASNLSHYMGELFRDEIDKESREEEDWDETAVSVQPVSAFAATAPAAAARPAESKRPAPVPSRPKTPPLPKPREIGRGVPAWQKALLAILILSAGSGLWLKFRQADEPQPQVQAAAPKQAAAVPPVPAPAPEATAPPAAATPVAEERKPDPVPVPRRAKAAPVPVPKAPEKVMTAKAAPSDAPPKQEGFRLTVNSDPSGAKVYLDGSDTGRMTPASFDGLMPEKQYAVRVSINGYGTYEQSVVSHGGPVSVNASLSQQFGSFAIDSRPWFFVLIDGEDKGATPLAGIKLTAGDHNMTLANPKLRIRRQVKLHIEPNKTTSLIIDPQGNPPVKEIIR